MPENGINSFTFKVRIGRVDGLPPPIIVPTGSKLDRSRKSVRVVHPTTNPSWYDQASSSDAFGNRETKTKRSAVSKARADSENPAKN
jgi:hypothetical protein